MYSSTATLVKYEFHHYIIFAAHALEGSDSIEKVYNFDIEGNFYKLEEYSIGYRIFEDDDIVIVDYFNRKLYKKNYFNINNKSLLGLNKKYFGWIGYPSSQAKLKKAHKTKSKEALKSSFIYKDGNDIYYTNVRYLTIISHLKSNNKKEITGIYNRKNTSLKYKGEVSTSPSPQGMSGGAMFFFPKDQKLKDDLDSTFRFAGIGIEYKKNNIIVGVPRNRIIELINIFNEESPLTMHMEMDKDNFFS